MDEAQQLIIQRYGITKENGIIDIRFVSDGSTHYEYLSDKGEKMNKQKINKSVELLLNEANSNGEVAKRIKGLVASIISTSPKYEIAIEYAIGNALQYVVTETADDAKYLIDVLNRKHLGRVTFIPTETVKPKDDVADLAVAKNEVGAEGLATELVQYEKEFASVVSYLLGNILVCDDTKNAITIAKKYNYTFKTVALDGTVVTTWGGIAGGNSKGIIQTTLNKR